MSVNHFSIDWLNKNVKLSVGQKEDHYQEYTWGKSVVLALSAMSLRGWNVTPNKTSSRIAFFS